MPPLSYYIGLLTSQYQNSPNLKAWLATLLQPIIDLAAVLELFPAAFDIDTAFGVQLDVVGQYIGVSRILPYTPVSGSATLTDDLYRLLLRAKIGRNQWDGTVGHLYSIWQGLFPGGTIVVQDGQNMTATILLSGAFTSQIIEMISHDLIVPRPQAVLYTYVYAALPVFGYGLNSFYVAGYGTGKYA